METNEIIKSIILLPRRFNEGRLSMYSLLKESGYFKFHKDISETDIFNILNNCSEYVSDWLAWSEDKRTSSGWYFSSDQKCYTVGYYPPKRNLKASVYVDKIEACAAFIKKEIESIRRS